VTGFILDRRHLLLGAGGLSAVAALPGLAWAQADPLADMDAVAAAFLAEFGTPGAALGVVRAGRPDWLKGYGVRRLGHPGKVDADTLFAVASNTKAMTAALLAMLVDEKKIAWDDPVTKHLPEAQMYDPATSAAMTVRDLLTHRSGLPLGAGDLMIWPTTTHTRADVVRGLRHLKPVRGFRTGYDYDNVLYVAAGALIEKVEGRPWEAVVSERILKPAGMATAAPAPSMAPAANLAGRHARLGGPMYGLGRMTLVERQETDSFAPAGGVQASVRDMAAWLRLQLARGVAPDGRRLWSEARAEEMWTPQTIISSSPGPTAEDPSRAMFRTYALGWNVFDYRGERVIGHSGGMNGQITYTAMVPARGLGVVVLTNAEERGVLNGLRNTLLDRLLGASPFDWLGFYRNSIKAERDKAVAELAAAAPTAAAGGPSLPLEAYAGLYRDPWYGDLRVTHGRGGLRVDFLKTTAFKGPLEPWGPDRFRTRFGDPTVEDAVLAFRVEGGRVVEVTAAALSPLADFSYDFHHLSFTPVS